MKTKTIEINAREWFDNKNGNSYFCGTVLLNYGLKSEETFLMPFQYGYGSQYECEAKAILTQFNKISIDNENLRMYCERMNIKLIRSIVRGCKQRELKQIEKDYNRKLETV